MSKKKRHFAEATNSKEAKEETQIDWNELAEWLIKKVEASKKLEASNTAKKTKP